MKKTLVLLISICIGQSCFGQAIKDENTFLLPINVALPEKKRINLAIGIPSGYRKIQDIQNDNAVLYDFIPETDDPSNWTEIITAQCYINSGFTAKSYINIVKNRIMENAHDIKIHNDIGQESKNYMTRVFCASYTHNNRREIIFARYYSGPYDCSGFQYTINMTTTESSALEKIKKFESDHVSVFNF